MFAKNENIAPSSLKNDATVIIKSAEYVSVTVCMDRQDYLAKVNMQLPNAMHYCKIGELFHTIIKMKPI